MGKCGILTISVGIMNYGNRLQNYALQQVLLGMGYEVETVKYLPQYPQSSYDTVNTSKSKTNYKSFFMRKLLYLRNRTAGREKYNKFDAFTKNRISWTNKEYFIDTDFSELKNRFDYIVCGSDQVWNPFWEGTQPIYFMQYMPYEKRIAYAASFGVSSIPDNMRKLYTQYLNNIKYISCREDAGVDIVSEMGNSNAIQVLDPVFLLNVEDWQKIEIKPDNLNADKYILVYFLGDIEKKVEKQIDIYSKQGYKAIYLDRRDKLNSIFASPEEFLYLVRNCELLCTDSFHGCAFSIIFNKPFICFDRTLNNGAAQNMNSRMASLFRLFNCDERMCSNFRGNPFDMDYAAINTKKEEEKKKSLCFLEESLNDRVV